MALIRAQSSLMIAHGSGLKLLHFYEDFHSKIAVETSCGTWFFPERFWKCLDNLQVIIQHLLQSAFPEQKIMFFLSSEKYAPGLWVHLFLRNIFIILIFLFVICFLSLYKQLTAFTLENSAEQEPVRLQFACVIVNHSQENLQIRVLFCKLHCR